MAREMLFGFCYMPQVLRVEDFSPYWVLDRWTKERTLADLKIMRAIGASCVRIHITPPVPGATAYDRLANRRQVPINGEKYLEMYDLIVQTLSEMGMAIHFDIGSSFSEVSEASLDGWMRRYKGRVGSYQFANENYSVFESDMQEGSAANFERFARLLAYARQIDPHVKFTGDIFPEQLAYMRERYPRLYDSLEILNTHPYYIADDRGWTDEWIAALVATHSRSAAWPAGVPWQPESIFMERFAGIADFGKELWVTEIAAQADGFWSALVPDETRAVGWRKIAQGLASCPQVTRVYYCWLTDKMHTMEAGVTQIGAVSYDGAVTQLTHAYRDMAEAYAPAGSIIGRLRIDVDTVRTSAGESALTLGLGIRNCEVRSAGRQPISGRAQLELPAGLSGDTAPFAFTLQPGERLERQVVLQVGDLPEPHNHVFLRVEADGQMHYGWGMVCDPGPLVLAGDEQALPGVTYWPDLATVQDFLARYGDECAIVVGPGSGHWDTELAYRLKIILEMLRDHPVPLKTAFRLPDVWDRPLIVVGRPALNFCAQLMEFTLPADRRAAALPAGQGFVQVVERPLGEPYGTTWDTSLREKLLGFHRSPAALYLAGGDDAGTQAAAYDLIRRLWRPSGSPGPKAHWL
jgi:hypothetical protein